MFRALLDLFRGESLIDQAVAETNEMLPECLTMFRESVRTLRYSDTAELKIDIRQKDKLINKYQRDVRRKVITHLSVSGSSSSLTPGLVLTSIVIDVERIGDITKNISELAKEHELKLQGGVFEDRLQKIEEILTEKFENVLETFTNSNVELAQKLMSEHRPLTNECESIMTGLIAEKDKNLSAGEAVCLALYVRYLKRISAHLTNIVSSVANPFPRIGFREKKHKKINKK